MEKISIKQQAFLYDEPYNGDVYFLCGIDDIAFKGELTASVFVEGKGSCLIRLLDKFGNPIRMPDFASKSGTMKDGVITLTI